MQFNQMVRPNVVIMSPRDNIQVQVGTIFGMTLLLLRHPVIHSSPTTQTMLRMFLEHGRI